MKQAVVTIAATGALLAVSGCSMFGGNGGPAGPDEFRVVTKAPLSVPPEYSLRPPPAGTTIPAEADPSQQAVSSAFGTTIGADASLAERALVRSAGASATNPVIRAIVDYEEAGVVRKSPADADQIISNNGTKPDSDSATGDATVSIARGSGERIKLPGT